MSGAPSELVALEKFYAGRRVLVTGGLGFVGSNLAHRLVGLGSVVTLVDALLTDCGGNWFNVASIRDRVRVEIASLCDSTAMARLVREPEIIFNLAGKISHIDSVRDPLGDLESNARGPLTLLEACRHYNPRAKVVYASTRQVYGRPAALPVDEEQRTRPTDVNGANKLAGETYHRLYYETHGLATVCLRLTNTFGPRQLIRHNRQGFLPWFLRCALSGGEITLYGDGCQLRDVNFVDDVVAAFLLAGASEAANGEIFNLGGREPLSLRDIAVSIVEAVGYGKVTFVPWPSERKKIDIGSYYADYSRIRQILGWEPTVSFAEGLRQTVAFFRANRAHYV